MKRRNNVVYKWLDFKIQTVKHVGIMLRDYATNATLRRHPQNNKQTQSNNKKKCAE